MVIGFLPRDLFCPSALQRAEQEPYSSGGGSDLSGSVQPGGAQAAEKQHHQTDRRGLLGPGQDESPVCKKINENIYNTQILFIM